MKVKDILTELGGQLGPTSQLWKEFLRSSLANENNPTWKSEQEIEDIWARVKQRHGVDEANRMQAWADAEVKKMMKARHK